MSAAQHRPRAPLRAAMPDSLDRFAADVERLRRVHATDQQLADAVAGRLSALVGRHGWLCAEHRRPAADQYRQHVLHVAPDGGFSVVALVWRPGQQTPIHDHVAWCVTGVYEGRECQTRYRLHRENRSGTPFLVEGRAELGLPGATTALVPPDEDIHRVSNCGPNTAISIHVYGADIGALGTSINQCFDDLPIRPGAGGGQAVRWRQG